MFTRWIGTLVFGGLVAAGAATSAAASPIDCSSTTVCNYTLDTFIGSGTPTLPSPYGSFSLTQNGANIDVSVSLNTNVFFAVTGAGEAFLWDFSGDPPLTSSDIVFSGTSVGKFTFDPSPKSPQDGSGDWDYGVICSYCGNGGSPPQLNSLNFTIDNHLLADFVQNTSGNNFAIDLCIGVDSRNSCLVTGDVLAFDAPPGTPTPAPEPATLLLVGTGLAGAAAARRRKIKNL